VRKDGSAIPPVALPNGDALSIYLAVLIGLATGTWGYRIADRRGRSHLTAVLVCGFFGLIGVGVYSLATRKPKHTATAISELAPMP
jgi:NhaP-type Na+/H+ or K+/H+ antiporter